MTDKLKPCPFCGGSSVGLVDKKDPQGRPTYTIICVHCGASINNYSTPKCAKNKWNTRTPKERGGEK